MSFGDPDFETGCTLWNSQHLNRELGSLNLPNIRTQRTARKAQKNKFNLSRKSFDSHPFPGSQSKSNNSR